MSEEGEKGFEIKDRRKAREALREAAETASGEEKKEREEHAQQTGDQEGDTGSQTAKEWHRKTSGPTDDLPPIDFISFISSLAATAFFHMGEKLAPDQPETAVDLPAAKQMIDLIDMLKAKTSGNLENGESEVLEHILYNLRMRYVKTSGGR